MRMPTGTRHGMSRRSLLAPGIARAAGHAPVVDTRPRRVTAQAGNDAHGSGSATVEQADIVVNEPHAPGALVGADPVLRTSDQVVLGHAAAGDVAPFKGVLGSAPLSFVVDCPAPEPSGFTWVVARMAGAQSRGRSPAAMGAVLRADRARLASDPT